MRAARGRNATMSWYVATLAMTSVAALAVAVPGGTLEGQHAAAQISKEHYIAVHSDLLYTHDADDRLFGVEHDLARDNVLMLLASYGLNAYLEPFTIYGYPSWNVVGEMPGTTRPDEIYIIGGHYDSIAWDSGSPEGNAGADDDASGVAAVLEIARLVSQWSSEATIRFIAFDREEWGLYGARQHAGAHQNEDIRGMLSLDMLAWRATPHNLAEIAGRSSSGGVKSALASALADYAGITAVDVGQGDYSDHAPFEWSGFQAACLSEYNLFLNPYYHTPLDRIETTGNIDYEYAIALTRGVMGWLVDAAGIAPGHLAGDMNCDGDVDGADINPFVLALTNPAGFDAAYPDCHQINADCNGDGQVDFADINPFMAMFWGPCGGPQAVAKLWAAGEPDDLMGTTVSVRGSVAAVGSNAENLGRFTGTVLVCEQAGGLWVETARLSSPAGSPDDLFGQAVAVDGDTLLVGAAGDSTSAVYAGAVYVFQPSAGVWTQTDKLAAADAAAWDGFGHAVALRGDTAVIGAPGADGVAPDAGAAYVFERVDGAWIQTAALAPPDGADYDSFGSSVATDGERIVVGATYHGDRGAAYVYERVGDAWWQTAKLIADDGIPGDRFGRDVALDGDTVVVGAHRLMWGEIGRSMAYVFQHNSGTWTPATRLGVWNHVAGVSVAIDGSTILIGRDGGDVPAGSGTVYVFETVGGTWKQTGQLGIWDGIGGDRFGGDVALDGGTAFVGTPLHSQWATAIGAAYVFTLTGDGTPWLAEQPAAQTVALGEPATFRVTAAAPLALTYAWRKDGQRLTDDEHLSGTTTASLTISAVGPEDAGAYSVVVHSLCGTVVSEPAVLTVQQGAK